VIGLGLLPQLQKPLSFCTHIYGQGQTQSTAKRNGRGRLPLPLPAPFPPQIEPFTSAPLIIAVSIRLRSHCGL
jgi:hypothetical protein